MKFIIMLIFLICIMISVTFLTLLEQKILSYVQIRKGPNKVGFMGIFQPFCDAIKLFLKEFMMPIYSNYLFFYFSPIFSLLLSLLIWCVFPFFFNCINFNLMFLFMFSCMSLGVYFILFSGWSSNSNFSLLGSLRAVAQTISYEVCMIFFFLCFIFLILNFNLNYFFLYQQYFSFLYMNLMVCFIMLIIFLAESNRAPFDFAEGESELVSGFNIEYSSGGFALIFLAEYSMIIFLSMIYCFMFLFNMNFYLEIYLKIMILTYLFILIRGSYPRYRYDKLMNLTWKIYLPISLIFMIFFFMIKLMI